MSLFIFFPTFHHFSVLNLTMMLAFFIIELKFSIENILDDEVLMIVQ